MWDKPDGPDLFSATLRIAPIVTGKGTWKHEERRFADQRRAGRGKEREDETILTLHSKNAAQAVGESRVRSES